MQTVVAKWCNWSNKWSHKEFSSKFEFSWKILIEMGRCFCSECCKSWTDMCQPGSPGDVTDESRHLYMTWMSNYITHGAMKNHMIYLNRGSLVSQPCSVQKFIIFDNWNVFQQKNRNSVRFELNSLWASDAIWRHRSWPTLAHVMDCCLMAEYSVAVQWVVMDFRNKATYIIWL